MKVSGHNVIYITQGFLKTMPFLGESEIIVILTKHNFLVFF